MVLSTPDDTQPVIIWLGRFSHPTGYGVITRSYARGMRAVGLPCLMIDSMTQEIVGPDMGIDFEFNETDGAISLTLPQGRPAIVVFSETFEAALRLRVDGACRKVLFTVFEDDSLLARWRSVLSHYDEIWTPSHFNRATLEAAGVPPANLFVLPCVGEPVFQDEQIAPLSLKDYNSTVFLSVVSNFNRKNISELIRTYCETFTASDDVSLIVKLPKSLSRAQMENHVFSGHGNLFRLDDPTLPHIVLLIGHLSQERLAGLYKSVRAHISMERAKGWDLPSMEAMASGCEAVSAAWGANLDFMDTSNARLIPLLNSRTTPVEINENKTLYSVSDWPVIDAEACKTILRDLHETPYDPERRSKAKACIAENYSADAIGAKLKARVKTYAQNDFDSVGPVAVTLSKS